VGEKRSGGLGDLRERLTDGIDEEGRPESERVAGGAGTEAAGSSQEAMEHREGRRTFGSATRTSRRPQLVSAGVRSGGPRRWRTCVVRWQRDTGRRWLGFWEPAPGWWRPLIKGRAHPLACGRPLGGGAGVCGRDSQSPSPARRRVRDDKGGPRVSDRGGGRRSGPCWAVIASLGH
jgi:hypothetical protein